MNWQYPLISLTTRIKMQILLVRHAIAEDRETFALSGREDDDRPLTERGRKRMIKAARGIRRLCPSLDLLVSSPLTRAVETAAILADVYALRDMHPSRLAFDGLSPGRGLDPVVEWVGGKASGSAVALVGHEPEMSLLLGRLSSGREQSWFRFKKGGACLLESAQEGRGRFQLQWALTPAQLRILGAGIE